MRLPIPELSLRAQQRNLDGNSARLTEIASLLRASQ
jgi:hypothetical protein